MSQGVSQALFDICVSGAILRLWSGISNSPINGAQAGYGVGALIATFLSKPFVKFNPIIISDKQNSTFVTNQTLMMVESSDITLQIPYSLAAAVGLLLAIAFVFAQYFETINTMKFNKKKIRDEINEIEDLNANKSEATKKAGGILDKFNNLIFNDVHYESNVFKSKSILTLLTVILAMSIGGFSIILVNFMITFTTKGPAKLPLNSYFSIQVLFWIFIVVGRLLASLVAYKLNTLVYFFTLILLNLACIALYAIPYFNSIQKFYLFIIIPLSLFNAPVIPSIFMVLKHIMGKVSSILISLSGIGLAIGAISAQYLTSFILDKFEPKPDWLGYKNATSVYTIPIIVLFNVMVSVLVFFLLVLVYNFYKRKNKRNLFS